MGPQSSKLVTVLITDTFSTEALAPLRALPNVNVLHSQTPQVEPKDLRGIEVLIVRSRTKINDRLLAEAHDLKLILTSTSGFDHIEYKSCLERGILVAYAPQANVHSAAELTIYFLLALSRKMPELVSKVGNHQWRPDVLRGDSLSGQHLGLFGFGRIGRKVATLAQAFGMIVSACDPYLDPEIMREQKVEPMGLTELLVSSDFVSLHVPLTTETKHLINHQTLATINPDAFLINVSRGPIVDESELIVALDEGRLKGAALDVFEREPLGKESRLKGRQNVILTPHIGAFTESALRQSGLETLGQLQAYLTGEDIPHLLPLKTRWFSLVETGCQS